MARSDIHPNAERRQCVTVHGGARSIFPAPGEGDSFIFAAEALVYWAITPFVPRKSGQSPHERLRQFEWIRHGLSAKLGVADRTAQAWAEVERR